MKRANKQQREAAEKAALRQRLKDIAYGALGGFIAPDFEAEEFGGMAAELGLDAFGRWIGGIENALLPDDRQELTKARYLEHFDGLDEAVKFLWERGIRA